VILQRDQALMTGQELLRVRQERLRVRDLNAAMTASAGSQPPITRLVSRLDGPVTCMAM